MKNILKKIKKYYILIILLIISISTIILGLITYYNNVYGVTKNIDSIKLDNVNNLMIVAHPDDEILWGGAHLIEDNYLVVCITCGTNKVRVNEFVQVMNSTKDKFIMLGYPDKTNGERDNWDNHRDSITSQLDKIISLKDWDNIVTHNPDGEYGHIHHKMTSELVTNVVDKKKLDNLYYFGHYHSKRTIGEYYDKMVPVNDRYLSTKKKIIGLYKSQKFIQTMFDHMYSYEEWVKESEWSSELDEIN